MTFRYEPRWRHSEWSVSLEVGVAYDDRTWSEIESPSEYMREIETMAEDAGRDL